MYVYVTFAYIVNSSVSQLIVYFQFTHSFKELNKIILWNLNSQIWGEAVPLCKMLSSFLFPSLCKHPLLILKLNIFSHQLLGPHVFALIMFPLSSKRGNLCRCIFKVVKSLSFPICSLSLMKFHFIERFSYFVSPVYLFIYLFP